MTLLRTTLPLVLLALLGAAYGETVTWTGRGSNNLWDNPANWDPLKIPQDADDAIIPAGASALVGTANGARANSIVVNAGAELKVLGSNVTVGAGGVRLVNSVLTSDGGNSPFISSGPIWVNGTSHLAWLSGIFTARVIVDTAARITVDGAGAHTGDDFVVYGHMFIHGSILLTVTGTVTNYGLVWVFSGPGVTDLGRLNVVNLAAGQFVLNGTATVRTESLTVNSGTISTGISAFGNLNLANVALSAQLFINNGATLTNINGGNVSGGTGATITLSGTIKLQNLLSYQMLSCSSGSIDLDSFSVSGHLTLNEGCPLRTRALLAGGDLFTFGNGFITASTATLYGTVRVTRGFTLTITQDTMYQVTSLILDGTLNLGGSGTTTTVLGSLPSFVSVTAPQQPGALVHNGQLLVNNSLTVTFVRYSGSGTFQVLNNRTLDLQNFVAQPPSVTLNFGARLKGETVTLGWGALVGPMPGAKIGIIGDGQYEECRSPCAGKPGKAYQMLEVVTE